MNSSLRFLAVVSLFVAVPLGLSAVQSPGGAAGGQKGSPAGGREPVGLDGSMKAMNGGLKRLQGAVAGADFAQVAQIAVDMQRAAGVAKVETPWPAEKITDAAQKAEFVKGFRLSMIELERSLLDLEVAALDGKADDVKKIVEEKLKPMRNASHDKYNPER
jgi:soluble cytochrome b562